MDMHRVRFIQAVQCPQTLKLLILPVSKSSSVIKISNEWKENFRTGIMFIIKQDWIKIKDDNIANPTVYSTDQEVYFDEIEVVGTLHDFLCVLVSEKEYESRIEELSKELFC